MNSQILAQIAQGPQTNYMQQLMGVKAFKANQEEGQLRRNRMTQEIEAYKKAQTDKEEAKHVFDITSGALSSGTPQQARAVMQQYMLNDPNLDEGDKATLAELVKLPDQHLMEGLGSIQKIAGKRAGIALPEVKTPEPFTLGEGQGRYGPDGKLIVERPKSDTGKKGAGRDESGYTTRSPAPDSAATRYGIRSTCSSS